MQLFMPVGRCDRNTGVWDGLTLAHIPEIFSFLPGAGHLLVMDWSISYIGWSFTGMECLIWTGHLPVNCRSFTGIFLIWAGHLLVIRFRSGKILVPFS